MTFNDIRACKTALDNASAKVDVLKRMREQLKLAFESGIGNNVTFGGYSYRSHNLERVVKFDEAEMNKMISEAERKWLDLLEQWNGIQIQLEKINIEEETE